MRFNMNNLKKIIYFTLGILIIPFTLAIASTYLFNDDNYELFHGFWGSAYLPIYLLFSVIHRGKIAQKIPNKFVLFAILYTIAAIILTLLYML